LKENEESMGASEILDVVAGSADGPVKLSFEYTPGYRIHMNVKLSWTNTTDGILGKAFSESSTFDDPHEFSPSVSDNHWRLIQVNKVEKGMSPQECELLWALRWIKVKSFYKVELQSSGLIHNR
jgi:hypothetical protein